MDESQLESRLARSAPAAPQPPGIDDSVRAMVSEARDLARPARRRRRLVWLAVPVVPALTFALTAGIDARLVPDLTIPVSYTTQSGTPISCSIFVFNQELFGVETGFRMADALSTQDWSGIGERIYDTALRLEAEYTADPSSVDLDLSDTSAVQQLAWNAAENEVFMASISVSALEQAQSWGGDSDCPGLLR